MAAALPDRERRRAMAEQKVGSVDDDDAT